MVSRLIEFCLSTAAFRQVKRIWFHPWLIVMVSLSLLLGLSFSFFVSDDSERVSLPILLSLPFQIWVASLAVVSLLLSLPRLILLVIVFSASVALFALDLITAGRIDSKKWFDRLSSISERQINAQINAPDEDQERGEQHEES